ncbi:MAG TPA: Hsp20/alpha crystallin family protein [Chromatiales bacterium]|nr:Hsp20/alpha crystallin family protein [Thiotrichales bacterium]HIP68898.1 Hsp20/alpha crystallin family protein [Chromatiales bacterium]
MSTLQQLREGLNTTWDAVQHGWQKLFRRATNAITRFTPGKKYGTESTNELALRNIGWGVLAAEVFDDKKKVVVRLEIPGMKKNDFELEIVDDYLVVRGEKQLQQERNENGYYISECAYGSFERVVPLPDAVKAEKAKASYKRGVLRVELPKATTSRRKKINVGVA